MPLEVQAAFMGLIYMILAIPLGLAETALGAESSGLLLIILIRLLGG